MTRSAFVLRIALIALLFSLPAAAQTLTDPALTVEPVVSGLSVPTTMAFLAPGDFLVLQKNNGQVRRVINGVLQPTAVLDVPVANSSEEGMLGIAINSQSPPRVFLYYTESTADGAAALGNRIYAYTWNPGNPPDPDAGRLQNPQLLRDLPAAPGPNHNGGFIILGPPEAGLAGDGRPLYAVIGDLNRDGQLENFAGGPAADDTGVIFRLQQNGAAHPANPFFPYCNVATTTTCTNNADCPAGQTCVTAVASYLAYGVRNSFGLALDPVTGNLWDTENGPSNYDEVNVVEPGFNSGWERIMGPVARDPEGTVDLFDMPGPANQYSDPEFSWVATIAPTGIVFPVGGSLGAGYNNVALVGDSNNGQIYRFPLNASRSGFSLSGGLADLVADSTAERDVVLLGSGFAGVVDLKLGPDGAVYVVSIGNGTIYRIRAAVNPTPTPTPSPAPATPTGTATPTPSNTATPTPTPTRTPSPTPSITNTVSAASVHVGDLDGSSANLGKNWQATVGIAVHDAAHSALAGATVNGAWSGGASASGSCVTAADGRCTVTSPLIPKKSGAATWTVGAVSSSGRVYQPGANHDPDGDSNGTAITVRK